MKRSADRRWEERCRADFGDEYAQFLLVKFEPAPRTCPVCHTETIREIWLGEAARVPGNPLQGLWYLWCDGCLRCIRSPIGACPVPEGSLYFQWSDSKALMNAMPRGLKMIEPTPVSISAPPMDQNKLKKRLNGQIAPPR